ncbi:hypothetical protein, partial [Microbacterium sp. K27]|uniref:hypothetical protein n=1 Tax=Microbacterium sp. K27 TaxID=2305445 RepID=UPI00109BD8FE
MNMRRPWPKWHAKHARTRTSVAIPAGGVLAGLASGSAVILEDKTATPGSQQEYTVVVMKDGHIVERVREVVDDRIEHRLDATVL